MTKYQKRQPFNVESGVERHLEYQRDRHALHRQDQGFNGEVNKMIIIQIIVMFLSLLLVFLSLSLDPESPIFRFRMLRRLPVIRFYFKAAKGIGKLKVCVYSETKELPSQLPQAIKESLPQSIGYGKMLMRKDEGFKQLVSLLRNESYIQTPQKVEKLIMNETILHSKEHQQWLNMVIDGKEEFVWGSSSHTMVTINELMELNKKHTRRQLTNILAIVAVLIFVLNSIYVICIQTGYQP